MGEPPVFLPDLCPGCGGVGSDGSNDGVLGSLATHHQHNHDDHHIPPGSPIAEQHSEVRGRDEQETKRNS